MGKNSTLLDIDILNSIEDQFDLILKDNRSVLEDMEMIMYGLKEFGLTESFKEKYEKYGEQICRIYQLSFIEAVFFTLFIEESNEGKIDFYDFKQICKCSKLKFLNYLDDIDSLVKKKLIKRVSSSKENKLYRILDEVVECVRKGVPYNAKKIENLSKEMFYSELGILLENGQSYDLDPSELQYEIIDLVQSNKNLNLVKNILTYKLDSVSLTILLVATSCFINDDTDSFTFSDLDDFIDISDYVSVKQKLKNGTHILFSKELIDNQDSDRVTNPNIYKLTHKAKVELEIDDITKIQKSGTSNLIISNTLKSRILYYNPQESIQVKKLYQLLEETQFQKIQSKLNTQNFRIGFNCLFYGLPGTGKTETVYQMAKTVGRDIYEVNIAQLKSKWYGESEKIIKQIFDDYNKWCTNSNVAPILLFNEADAIFSKRQTISGANLVRQTENTIQNILLNEMEHLNGILIATTNLTQNLDDAFERRFLYKIKFEKPNLEAKCSIWEMMFNDLEIDQDNIDFRQFALQFQFSGGQIENIARKCHVDTLLNQELITKELILQYCKEEEISKETSIRIGYVKN
jgi:hypothetical protein